MDTSKAQGELGWLLDPPEDGVSVRRERSWQGLRLQASGKWGGEVGGGNEKRAGKTGSVSLGGGREADSEAPEWDLGGGGREGGKGVVRLHPTGNVSIALLLRGEIHVRTPEPEQAEG